MTTTKATEALAKIGEILPMLATIPLLRKLPNGLKLDTDTIAHGILTIERIDSSDSAGNRAVHIVPSAASSPSRPVCVRRSWLSPTGNIETTSTTTISRREAKAEITAALEWLRTP